MDWYPLGLASSPTGSVSPRAAQDQRLQPLIESTLPKQTPTSSPYMQQALLTILAIEIHPLAVMCPLKVHTLIGQDYLLVYKELPASHSPSVKPNTALMCFSLAHIIHTIVVFPVLKHTDKRQLNCSRNCLFVKRI